MTCVLPPKLQAAASPGCISQRPRKDYSDFAKGSALLYYTSPATHTPSAQGALSGS